MVTLNELEQSGMLDPFIANASQVQLETMLESFRIDKEKYDYLKGKVKSLTGMSVRIEHDFPRVRRRQA